MFLLGWSSMYWFNTIVLLCSILYDNIVNILDVIVTVNYLIGHIDLTTVQQQNADMNLDGNINVPDILMIVDLVLED